VIGVIAQRLVRSLCPDCRTAYKPGMEELTMLGLKPDAKDIEIYKATGCNLCGNRGYSGRLAILEIMAINEDIRRLTLQRPNSDQVNEIALAGGMKTMRDHAIEKILAGQTTYDEARRRVFFEEDI